MTQITALLMYLATILVLFAFMKLRFLGFIVLFCGPDFGALLGCAIALWMATFSGASAFTFLAIAHLTSLAYAIGKIQGTTSRDQA